ncbi:unnamed protein product [Linum tenue]|uniref:AB hydrolase-1 domain-containing protein n=1 Tax=Linum tenue TaxID=586396 RepID=A0AAV0PMP9_9ROSI|nr:unnamed protein product [Linum tenue]
MAEVRGGRATWHDDLATLMEDSGMRYAEMAFDPNATEYAVGAGEYNVAPAPVTAEAAEADAKKPEESLKEQVTEFAKAWGELLLDLGKGCKDIAKQNLLDENSFLVQKLGKPIARASGRLAFMNDCFLPEDRDPVHAWPVVFFVFLLAVSALGVNTRDDSGVPIVKKVRLHPPSANRVSLPDGRQIAYLEHGVAASRARFSVISPHCFLSSRLGGFSGVETTLLEEFGVRLITYDLPGFGESDPHPARSLNSSAQDMLHLADAVGLDGKFWVLGFSTGSMHSWAALTYIPHRIAGAAMFAPMVNPYEPSMTKEETTRTWENWSSRRKLMYFLARRFPSFLPYFYRRSFLSGNHGQIEKWMSQPLGRKDEILVNQPTFQEFWHRDVEESVRQGRVKPFIEEAVLQTSNWGFNLADLQVRRRCQKRGLLLRLRSMFNEAECELVGFLGPIHIWQGADDHVVPPSAAEYISRVIPGATLHKLPNEGHFSYFFFCKECHRRIFSTLFGDALGPLDENEEASESPFVLGATDNETSVTRSFD